MTGYVYILANKPHGTLYIGVTNDLLRRITEHRLGAVHGFTRKYNLKNLVYVETYDDLHVARHREKSMKAWKRAWKIELIEKENPQWRDLFFEICG